MEKTYKFTLPQNKEVQSTKVRVENGEVIVNVEFKDKFEPKDGDFLTVLEYGCVFIYNKKIALYPGCFCAYCGEFSFRKGDIVDEFSNNWIGKNECRFATEKEKAAFLERLENECGKRWNAVTKELEDIRWKPKIGETFYYVSILGDVKKSQFNLSTECTVNSNNCFKTEEAAKPYAEQIKEIFKNSKAE